MGSGTPPRDNAPAMSDENVAALNEAFARFEREGSPPFEMFAPDIELINFDSFPVTRPYHGHDGMVQWLIDMSEPFEAFRFELVEVLAHDDDRVVTTCRATGCSGGLCGPFGREGSRRPRAPVQAMKRSKRPGSSRVSAAFRPKRV
jgi:hypothetical protein